jgi:alkanesulfonate monooxygenase SsuD/methylene tetrahydromethanopterin reductase-like flavin-dependent oxidoreductase (luciferase family)
VILDLHVNQSIAPWSRVRSSLERIDSGTYDTLWVLDHFATLGPAAEGEMLDPHVTLGALAATTTKVNLGVLVNNVANRSAAVIAGATASLQAISAGRAVLGLGAGASPNSPFAAEHRALNIALLENLADRHNAVMSTLAEIRSIWDGQRHGAASGQSENPATFPTPTPLPPVVVGVNSVALASRAAGVGCGINVRWNHPQVEVILAKANHQVGPYASSVWVPFSPEARDPEAHRRFADMGATRVVLLTTQAEDLDAA